MRHHAVRNAEDTLLHYLRQHLEELRPFEPMTHKIGTRTLGGEDREKLGRSARSTALART